MSERGAGDPWVASEVGTARLAALHGTVGRSLGPNILIFDSTAGALLPCKGASSR